MKKIQKENGDVILTKDVPIHSIILLELDSPVGRWAVPVQVELEKFKLIAFEYNYTPNRWNEETYYWSEIMGMVQGSVNGTKIINAYLFDNRDEMFKFMLDQNV